MGNLWKILMLLTFIQACIFISVSAQQKEHSHDNAIYHEGYSRVPRDIAVTKFLTRPKRTNKDRTTIIKKVIHFPSLINNKISKVKDFFFGKKKFVEKTQFYYTRLIVNEPWDPKNVNWFYRYLEDKFKPYFNEILCNHYGRFCKELKLMVRLAEPNTNDPKHKVDVVFRLQLPTRADNFNVTMVRYINKHNEVCEIGPNYFFSPVNDTELFVLIGFNDYFTITNTTTITTTTTKRPYEEENTTTENPNLDPNVNNASTTDIADKNIKLCYDQPWTVATCYDGSPVPCFQMCDDYKDCEDNSDEDDDMCKRLKEFQASENADDDDDDDVDDDTDTDYDETDVDETGNNQAHVDPVENPTDTNEFVNATEHICKVSPWSTFSCNNDEIIECHQLCDGYDDCVDHSDENVQMCVDLGYNMENKMQQNEINALTTEQNVNVTTKAVAATKLDAYSPDNIECLSTGVQNFNTKFLAKLMVIEENQYNMWAKVQEQKLAQTELLNIEKQRLENQNRFISFLNKIQKSINSLNKSDKINLN